VEIYTIKKGAPDYPSGLAAIASPPAQLYYQGPSLDKLLQLPRVAIVGSRNVSAYGRQVTLRLARELAEQGIVIISGLALGVDALAHQAALQAGGTTLAVLPGSLQKVYPATNRPLATAILAAGGALLSEYGASEPMAYKMNFIARNRIVAGLADALLITEAAEKSGSLHTARFALEQGKDVLAVPGNITSPVSIGTNNLIKAGATPVTSYIDVLHALGLVSHSSRPADIRGRNLNEQRVLDLLVQGIADGDDLLAQSQLSIAEFNQTLTMLEISSKVRSLGANHWALY